MHVCSLFKNYLISFFCLFLCQGYSQVTQQEEMTLEEKQEAYRKKLAQSSSEQAKHITEAYRNMIQNANASYLNSNSQTCDAFDYIESLDIENIVSDSFKNESYHWLVSEFLGLGRPVQGLGIKIDKGGFKTVGDKLLNAFGNSTDFIDFVMLGTEKNLGQLSEKDQAALRKKYNFFKNPSNIHLSDMDGGKDHILSNDDCTIAVDNFVRKTKYNYPNVDWLFTSRITYDCTCKQGSNKATLNKATYEYTSKTTSIYTAADIVFNSSISNAELTIKNVVCCPENNRSEKPLNALLDGDGEHFTKDTRNLFLDPKKVDEYKKQVKKEWGENDDEASDAEGSFFKEAGYFAYGASLGFVVGEEKDFYGINYGANVGYIFEFIDSKFSSGPEVEYSRFTGKETDFGFETEGVGFLNIKARANYSLTDWLEASVGGGYGIGLSEGVDGGIGFDVGAEISPSAVKRQDVSSSTRIYYSLRFKSNSVEGGSFKSINAGVGIKLN